MSMRQYGRQGSPAGEEGEFVGTSDSRNPMGDAGTFLDGQDPMNEQSANSGSGFGGRRRMTFSAELFLLGAVCAVVFVTMVVMMVVVL